MTAQTTSGFSTVIDPEDGRFYGYVHGGRRQNSRALWSYEALASIVEALNGQRVAIVVDTLTGATETGVKLVAADRQYGQDSRPGVTVERTFADGTTQRTRFSSWSVGMILPLEESIGTQGAKWTALDIIRSGKYRHEHM